MHCLHVSLVSFAKELPKKALVNCDSRNRTFRSTPQLLYGLFSTMCLILCFLLICRFTVNANRFRNVPVPSFQARCLSGATNLLMHQSRTLETLFCRIRSWLNRFYLLHFVAQQSAHLLLSWVGSVFCISKLNESCLDCLVHQGVFNCDRNLQGNFYCTGRPCYSTFFALISHKNILTLY